MTHQLDLGFCNGVLVMGTNAAEGEALSQFNTFSTEIGMIRFYSDVVLMSYSFV